MNWEHELRKLGFDEHVIVIIELIAQNTGAEPDEIISEALRQYAIETLDPDDLSGIIQIATNE